MALEDEVSRAALLSGTMQAALHSEDPWFIEIGGVRVPAERTVGSTFVAFTARFPLVCFVVPPRTMSLWHGDVLRSVKPLTSAVGVELVSWEFEMAWGRVAA